LRNARQYGHTTVFPTPKAPHSSPLHPIKLKQNIATNKSDLYKPKQRTTTRSRTSPSNHPISSPHQRLEVPRTHHHPRKKKTIRHQSKQKAKSTKKMAWINDKQNLTLVIVGPVVLLAGIALCVYARRVRELLWAWKDLRGWERTPPSSVR
jgi:uncharacterized surface anchored protein